MRPLAWGLTAALAGTMAANAFYLTMQFYYFYAFLALRAGGAARVPAARGVKVLRPDDVVSALARTTSPGSFVADAVEACGRPASRCDVVSPATSAISAIAYGGGIVQNLRARPWLVAAVPLFLAAFARAARRAARDADVVHAHWIPSGARGARDREAVRAPGVGDGRRARAPRCRGSRGRSCGGRGS